LGLARRIWVSPVGAEFRKAVRHRGVVPVVTVWARWPTQQGGWWQWRSDSAASGGLRSP